MASDKKTLKWLRNKIKGNKLIMSFLIIGCIFFSALTVSLAYFLKKLINSAIELSKISNDVNKHNLIMYSIIIISVVILQLAFWLINNYLKEKVRFRLEIKLKQDLLNNILSKDFGKISAFHSGDLLNRMFSDNVIIAEVLSGLLPSLASMISKLIFAFSLLFAMNITFTLILLFAGILVIAFSLSLRKVMKKFHKRTQEADGKTRAFMQESTENILAIKVFSCEHKISDKAEKLQKDYYNKRINQRKLYIGANSIMSFGFSLAYVFALIFGAYNISRNNMDYGTLSAILQLVTQIQSPLASLGGVIPQFYSMIASCERVIEIEEIAQEVSTLQYFDRNDFYQNLLEINFKDITFKYNRDVILENANLKINKGDFVCIQGISGIGKSTLLKLLLGVYINYNGDIYFKLNSGNINAGKDYRKLFAYVPQGNLLFSGTIKENICFINENASEEEIENALKLSCSYSFIKDLPQGLQTIIGENGLGISEGQMQRIAIARALLTKAPILLLDEATSALDEKTEEELLNNLKSIKNITLIIISHKNASKNICNRQIAIMNKKIMEI